MQQDSADDYVLGTGEAHTLEEFAAEAFGYAGLDWHDFVDIDPGYIRPAEVDFLLANSNKARTTLGWEAKIRFGELVRIMVDADMESVGLKAPGDGTRIIKEKLGSWHHSANSVSPVEKASVSTHG